MSGDTHLHHVAPHGRFSSRVLFEALGDAIIKPDDSIEAVNESAHFPLMNRRAVPNQENTPEPRRSDSRLRRFDTPSYRITPPNRSSGWEWGHSPTRR